jgi:hypothetical protein
LSFLGLAEASAEFEALSKQAATFSTSFAVTGEVTIPPGYKGYLTAATWGSTRPARRPSPTSAS